MSPSSVAIRRATQADARVVVDIYVESSNAGFQSRLPLKQADEARTESWRYELSDATLTRWWVAERGSCVVGVVGIGPCRDPVEVGLGELDTIAVVPSAWHTGVGKALMAAALEGFRRDGYRSAALWTLSNYPLGETFYVATGWQRSVATRDNGNQVRYNHDLSQ